MKKINFPLIAILALSGSLLFASCKKDYTCACNVGVPGIYDTTINIAMNDFTKKQARKACENNEVTIQTVSAAFFSAILNGSGDSTIPSNIPLNVIPVSCELK